jgi:hypothetical protein
MSLIKKVENLTLGIGATETSVIGLNGAVPVGIVVSGSSLTASKLTFLVSNDNSNFYSLYDQTAEISVTTGSYLRAYSLDWTKMQGWKFMKIRSGTSASAVAQATIATGIEVNIKEL